jgi:hypothetical protein
MAGQPRVSVSIICMKPLATIAMRLDAIQP